MKYPNTATFQDERDIKAAGGEFIDDLSTASIMRGEGVTQKYYCLYAGYVTAQLPTGLLKQTNYSVGLVFDLDSNNKPINIKADWTLIGDKELCN